jgi:hypothetical protein
LKGNHSSLLGWVQVGEGTAGLFVYGMVISELRRFARGKPWLSLSFTVLEERQVGPVQEIVAARLHEVSLVDRGGFEPYTLARLTEAIRQ